MKTKQEGRPSVIVRAKAVRSIRGRHRRSALLVRASFGLFLQQPPWSSPRPQQKQEFIDTRHDAQACSAQATYLLARPFLSAPRARCDRSILTPYAADLSQTVRCRLPPCVQYSSTLPVVRPWSRDCHTYRFRCHLELILVLILCCKHLSCASTLSSD